MANKKSNNDMPHASDILFSQLTNAKNEIEHLIREISYRQNQLLMIYRCSKTHHDIDLLLSAGYNLYSEELKKMLPKNLKVYRGHYTRCSNERKDIIAHLSRLEQENLSTLKMLYFNLRKVQDMKKYLFFKKRIEDFENLVLKTPIKIIEECFSAEIVRPEHGDLFNKNGMDEICFVGSEIIDDVKQLKHKKTGTFVDECTEYGATDKNNHQIIVKPAVSIYTVELADKYKIFHFLK